MRRVLAIVLAVVGAPALSGQVTEQAIPPQWLSGTTLTVSDMNFTVTAPDSWRWRQIQVPVIEGVRADGFRASNAESERTFAVLVYHIEMRRLLTGESERFAGGLAKTLPSGWSVAKIETSASAAPASGSQRFTVILRGPDNAEGFYHGYLVPGRLTYMLFTTSGERTEPADFARFVGTFRLLRPGENIDTGRITTGLMFWLAVIGAGFDWRYRRAGGARATRRQKLGFGVALACCVGLLVMLALRGRSAGDIGEMTAMLLSPLFFFWEFARWRTRRTHPIVRVGQLP